MTQNTTRLLLALSLVLGGAGCARETPGTPAEPVLDRNDDRGPVDASGRDDRDDDDDRDDGRPFTVAVIGDIPYGDQKLAELPGLISLINADRRVERVIHLGDIKAGKNSPCTDAYFSTIRSLFDRFEDPLVYTPGDNEWTDCHVDTKNNGLFTPTERLQAVRALFFPEPGRTLGRQRRRVESQAFDRPNAQYVENVEWTRSGVVFAALNITGSNNDGVPWGAPLPADAGNFPSQATEQLTRARANTAWLERTFALARQRHAPAVVLALQADMWDPAEPTLAGYDDLVQRIGTLAVRFGRPVLLLEGDSHVFNIDHPFTPASPFFPLHPATPVAPNVTRLVVEGSDKGRTEYTRLTIDPRSNSPFSFERVPLVP